MYYIIVSQIILKHIQLGIYQDMLDKFINPTVQSVSLVDYQSTSKNKKAGGKPAMPYTLQQYMDSQCLIEVESDYEWIYEEYLDYCDFNDLVNEPYAGSFAKHFNKANMTMTEKTHEDTQRTHLRQRLETLRQSKESAARKHFGLHAIYPTNDEEMIAWVKAGNYRLKDEKLPFEDKLTKTLYWGKNDPDNESYSKTAEQLKAAYQKALDDILILPPLDALASLRAFEDTSFH
jgi:hypothetical protein